MALSLMIVGGTDAPGIRIVPDGHGGFKIEKVPGWNPDAMSDFSHALKVVDVASRIRQQGVAEVAIKSVMQFVQKEFDAHVKNGGVVVLRQ